MVKGDSRLEQKELFQSIANTITATLNLPTCIWVLDEKAQALRIAGAMGLRPAYAKRAILKLDEPSVTGVVLQTGQTLAVRNILEDERWKYRKEAENRGWKSVLCVPIKVADRTLGVVSIYTIVEREFNPSEQELLERYATLIGTSLENAKRGEMLRRLFEVGQFVEESIAKSPEAVLRRIVKGACEVSGADCAVIYPPDPYRKGYYDVDKIAAYGLQTKLRILATSRPREEDGTGAQISREGQLVVNDIERERPELLQDSFVAREGVRAFMGTALKIGEEAMGVLYVNFRRPHPFTQDEQDIIQLLSHQAAIAIYNSRLFEQTKRRADTLAQLSDISRSLLSMEDIPRSLDKALKHIASSAKKVLRADMVDLYQYIEETAEFKLPPILVGKRKQPLVPLVPTEIFSDDVIVKILEGDQPQYFEKAQEAPLLSGRFEIEREDKPEQRFVFREEIESSAAVPLKATGETVGVMFVNYRSPQLFGPGQREQIELFAKQAAIAIENARLYKQLERKYMELETEYIAREQLAALGTATAALQHRISNTLNLVNPGIMRLRRRIDPNDKDAAETLDIMERNVRYTSQIISRLQEPLKEEIATVTDVNSRLKEIVQDVREKEPEMCQKVTFDLDGLSPGIPRIEFGTGQLTEVLRNLVENACKAMQPQGGTLTLSSRLVGSTIEVEFQDTGPGILPNIRERLFTRPVPPKDFGTGTGLGLWLSKLILQKYGGDIEVKETSEGEGTTMLIRLPTIQQPTTKQAESEDAS